MTIQRNDMPVLGRIGGAGLGKWAFLLGAAWALSVLAPTPAKALDSSWEAACTFKNAPQGYAEMMRERACMSQNFCQHMADMRGSTFTGNGCFMVEPSAPHGNHIRR